MFLKTKLGKLVYSLLFATLFFILYNRYDWAIFPALAFMLYPIGLTLTFIVYAWIINPMRNKNKQ